MKVTKKMYTLLAGIFILSIVVYFFTIKGARNAGGKKNNKTGKFNIQPIPLPQQNASPDVNILQTIPPMPTASEMQTQNNAIANFPDLDRTPLDDESLSLLQANEMIANNYKDWYGSSASAGGDSVDKELYAKGKPLFNQKGNTALVPFDVNVEKRRVNFY